MSSGYPQRVLALWPAIAETVPGQYLCHHGVWLVGIGTAPKVVEEPRAREICIGAIEGFVANGRTIRPRMDAIADFPVSGTWPEQVNKSADDCLHILSLHANDPIFIEFTIAFEDDLPEFGGIGSVDPRQER